MIKAELEETSAIAAVHNAKKEVVRLDDLGGLPSLHVLQTCIFVACDVSAVLSSPITFVASINPNPKERFYSHALT